ncbi:MAG: type II toxin-antitoxin system MqsR family toxin [Candidatus Atribacteria bacterium]|nr:type II toxin-antitoxin system MqsR family toxin [Candidatus Atribacteria bacterium]
MQLQREIVRNILIKIKSLVAKGNYIFLWNRKENFETLLELGLKYSHVKQEILSLTPKEYSQGPLLDKDQTNYKNEYFWIFGKNVQNKLIYIKLKIRKTNEHEETVCMSFHIAEYQMKFPLKY